MRTLMIVLFLALGTEFARAQVPYGLSLEMNAEEPETRETLPLGPLWAVSVLHFPKAKLLVVTRVRMVEPKLWIFRERDIELITREVDGKIHTLYEKKEET